MSQNKPVGWTIAAIGAIAGLASGLLGVGGGFLIVPLLVMWSGMKQRDATGTSLAAIPSFAAVGALAYYFGIGSPQVDLGAALFLSLGSVFGAYTGAMLSPRLPDQALSILVAILLLAVGVKETHDALVGASVVITSHVAGKPNAADYAAMTLAGFGLGVLSGLTGIGGGILIVPTMVIGFGIAQRVAQGTSLLAILPTAGVGAVTHYRHHHVNMRAAALISAAGTPAAAVGATAALWMPERILLGLFGLFLCFAAAWMWPRRITLTTSGTDPGHRSADKM